MLNHLKVSTKGDGSDPSLVQPSDWNADHVFTGDVTLPANLIVTGKIGIGMVPVNVLDVTQNVNTAAAIAISNPNVGTGAYAIVQASTPTGSLSLIQWGTNYTTVGVNRQDGSTLQSGGAGGLTFNTGGAPREIYFCQNSVETARFDVGGRFGLGRAPENWIISYKVIALGQSGSLTSVADAQGIALNANSYWNGAVHTAITTGAAAQFGIGNGALSFYNAVSVAAGATLAYTERLNLNTAGKLTINQLASYNGNASGLNGTTIVQLPGGLIIQSGYAYVGVNTITLPMTFPNYIMGMWATVMQSTTPGAAGFFAVMYPDVASSVSVATNTVSSYNYNWTVIGY